MKTRSKIYFALSLVLVLAFACAAWADDYTATSEGEHAYSLTNGTTATLNNKTFSKTGDASGQSDDYDWKGTNAAILVSGGSTLNITGSSTTIDSNAKYGNAVFAYGGNSSNNSNNSGDGSTINISDATIKTSSNNSGGIMVTGGGIIKAENLTVTTESGSSAAIRSDRGGGTITATGGTYTTNGTGSPAVYSTAAITVNNATLKTTKSQGLIIEGGNSITLSGTDVEANNTTHNGQDTTYSGVLIYQSQSGDASNGSSTFTMTNGSLKSTNGDVFLVTNTTCTINLTGVTITNSDSSNGFLRAAAQKWGSSGSNGGKVTLNASGQTITGDIYIDSSSTLTLNLTNGSKFTGAITNSSHGTVNVVIDSTSSWTLTGNSYVTSITNNGTLTEGSYTLTTSNGSDTGDDTTGDDTTGDDTTGDDTQPTPPSGDDTQPTPPSGDSTNSDLTELNDNLQVEADSSGNYSTLPSGSVVSSSSGYELILDNLAASTKDTTSTTDSSSGAKKITASLSKALPYGTILLVVLEPSNDDPYYAAMIHSGKAGSSSSSLVIDTSKLYDPEDTTTRVRFPAGTYTVAFATLDVIASTNTLSKAEEFTAAASSVSGVSGNLGDIKLASTNYSSGGGSSSGCDAGFGLIALAAVALLANGYKRVGKI